MRFAGLSIRQLEAFDMIMLSGSVSAAATALHISQPSVSRLLQDLERDCDLKLFDRAKGRLIPTPQGIMFHEEVARSFKSARELMVAARNIRDLKQSRLRIGALAACSLEIVPTALRNFRENHPDAVANVAVRSSSDIVKDVATQHLDIGIIDGGIPILDAQQVANYSRPCVCVMDRDHPLAALVEVDIGALGGFPFVSLGTEFLARSANGRALLDRIQDKIEVETFQSVLACGFVRHSTALSVVDPFTAKFYSEMGLISRPLVEDIPFQVSVIVNHRSRIDGNVELFVDQLDSLLA